MRRRRRHREDLEEETAQAVLAPEEAVEKPAPAAAPTTADRALELQKTAGNRAVGAALERWPMPKAQAPVAGQNVAVFDDDLRIPVLSANEPEGRRERGEDDRGDGELVVISPPGEHSLTLQQAVIQGKTFARVVLVVNGVRLILTNVLVSSIEHGGHAHTWRLHYSKREFAR